MKEVQNKLEDLIFNEAQSRNRLDAYDRYLSEYPKGKYVQPTKSSREELFYKAAVSANTVESYDRYLSEYPKGKYVQPAKSSREELFYKAAVSANTVESYDRYLSEYPKGQYQPDVLKRKEALILLVTDKGCNVYIPSLGGTAHWSGSCKDGKLDGDGQLVMTDRQQKELTMEGTFKAGYPAGVTQVKFSNGSIAVIDYQPNRAVGYAIWTTGAYQGEVYQGEYQGFARAGIGKLTWANGDSYQGQWRNNQINGMGQWANKQISLSGRFTNGKFEEGQVKADDTKQFGRFDQDSVQAALRTIYETQSRSLKIVFLFYLQKNTIESYDEFIVQYPDHSGVGEAISLEYELYRKRNTVDGYDEFVNKYSRSPEAEKAITAEYELYRKRNTVDGYDEFVNKYSRSPEAEKAITAEYELYRHANLVPGYRMFMSKYPNTREAVLAMEQIHRIAFGRARDMEGYVGLEEFQRAFPYAKQYEEAGKQAYARELDEMKNQVKQRGGNFKAAERIARLKRVEAQQSEKQDDYWIAARKYSLIIKETPFNETDAAISLVEKQEAQTNNEKLVILISGVRSDIASLGNALSRQLADIRDRQGEVAQVIQRQTDQMELASEQARSRSEA
ncbi:hypothetical protein WDW89_19165, partial [Deltaproteobacteria bacterium TL4]